MTQPYTRTCVPPPPTLPGCREAALDDAQLTLTRVMANASLSAASPPPPPPPSPPPPLPLPTRLQAAVLRITLAGTNASSSIPASQRARLAAWIAPLAGVNASAVAVRAAPRVLLLRWTGGRGVVDLVHRARVRFNATCGVGGHSHVQTQAQQVNACMCVCVAVVIVDGWVGESGGAGRGRHHWCLAPGATTPPPPAAAPDPPLPRPPPPERRHPYP